jgi:hypothetical protein
MLLGVLWAVPAAADSFAVESLADESATSASFVLLSLGAIALQLYMRRPSRSRAIVRAASAPTARAIAPVDVGVVLASLGFVGWVLATLARDIRAKLADLAPTDRLPILGSLSIGSLAAFLAIAVTGEPRVVFVAGMSGLAVIWLIQTGTGGAER